MFTTPILVGTGPVGAVAAGVAGAAGVAAPCPKAAVPSAMLRPIAIMLNFAMLMDYVLLGFRARPAGCEARTLRLFRCCGSNRRTGCRCATGLCRSVRRFGRWGRHA